MFTLFQWWVEVNGENCFPSSQKKSRNTYKCINCTPNVFLGPVKYFTIKINLNKFPPCCSGHLYPPLFYQLIIV